MSDHGGTHVDSIEHVSRKPGALTIDKIPLDWFYGPAICLDVSHLRPKAYISKKDLSDALIKHKLEIMEGDTVLLYTGSIKKLGTWEYLTEYPGLHYEATIRHADKKVRNVGADAPSIDNPADKSYPAHRACGEKDMLNMGNLGDLKEAIRKRFKIVLFPLKLRGCTDSPVRVVATGRVEKDSTLEQLQRSLQVTALIPPGCERELVLGDRNGSIDVRLGPTSASSAWLLRDR